MWRRLGGSRAREGEPLPTTHPWDLFSFPSPSEIGIARGAVPLTPRVPLMGSGYVNLIYALRSIGEAC